MAFLGGCIFSHFIARMRVDLSFPFLLPFLYLPLPFSHFCHFLLLYKVFSYKIPLPSSSHRGSPMTMIWTISEWAMNNQWMIHEQLVNDLWTISEWTINEEASRSNLHCKRRVVCGSGAAYRFWKWRRHQHSSLPVWRSRCHSCVPGVVGICQWVTVEPGDCVTGGVRGEESHWRSAKRSSTQSFRSSTSKMAYWQRNASTC